MKKGIFYLFIFLQISSLHSQSSISDTIVSAGIVRAFRLYIPAAYPNSTSLRPLVINMHGYTGNALQQQNYTGFTSIADTANFLVVFPEGTFLPGTSNTYWNANFSANGVNDVMFLADLIDTLQSRYNIDSSRIYATGFSNGGFMSHTLACALSGRIAAIASVSGTMADTQYGINGSNCKPERYIPVMQIHGDADMTVPYKGGTNLNINMMAVDSVLKFWVNHNLCNAEPAFSNIPDIDTYDNCTASHYVYSGCASGTAVELFRINSGGHTWPGSFPINWWEATNQDINASAEIWKFFRKFKHNEIITNTPVISNAYIGVFPNPANELLNVSVIGNKEVSVVDFFGRIIIQTQINHSGTIDISQLENGVYFLRDGISARKFIKQ